MVAVSSEHFPNYTSLLRHNLAVAHSRKTVGFFVFNVYTVSLALSNFHEYHFPFYWVNLCYLTTQLSCTPSLHLQLGRDVTGRLVITCFGYDKDRC